MKCAYGDPILQTSSQNLTGFFAETMHKGEISFIDLRQINAEPFNINFTQDEQDLIKRVLYLVRRGKIKVVDKDKES